MPTNFKKKKAKATRTRTDEHEQICHFDFCRGNLHCRMPCMAFDKPDLPF
jgi:hypothetical protein